MTAGRRWAAVALAVSLGLVVTSCTDPDGAEPTATGGPTTSDAPTTSTPSPTPTQEPALAWGPTEADLDAAMADAADLSDAEAAGQVLIARYTGTDPDRAADLVSRYDLAGVILFSENISSDDQVVATADAVQDAVGRTRDWPGIVSVDDEGGIVQRLNGDVGPWTTFPPLQAAGAASEDPDVISAAYEAMGREQVASGITVDFAPDADVTVGPSDVTIGTRSAGSDPERVADTVVAALQGFAAGGVLTSLKHFPGHGSLNVDSHQSLPVLDTPIADLEQDDLVPFAAGIDAGAPMVMVGHIAVTAWDPGVPASLSPAAYDYLRDDLGFTGVAITDGLDMGALTAAHGPGEIAALALEAGADLLLSPTDVGAARDGILDALDDGSLSRDRLTEAAGRVIAMQRWQARLAEEAGDPGSPGDAAAAAAALAAAAVTVVRGQCSGALAGPRIHVRGGSESDWNAFVGAAEDAGLDVVPLEQDADTDVRLLTSSGAGDADVAIALDQPYVLEDSRADTLVAGYGHAPATMTALARVLAGEASAPGRLPVAVGDLPSSACD